MGTGYGEQAGKGRHKMCAPVGCCQKAVSWLCQESRKRGETKVWK